MSENKLERKNREDALGEIEALMLKAANALLTRAINSGAGAALAADAARLLYESVIGVRNR